MIPTYRRGEVLLRTLELLFRLDPPPGEILVVDQTERHPAEVERELGRLACEDRIRRVRFSPPSIPQAMNRGVLEARSEIVLFLDDDVVPGNNLIEAHLRAYAEHPEAWAVVGQVIQPEDGEAGERRRKPGVRSRKTKGGLNRDLDFQFNGVTSTWVENAMAGNLSVRREKALAIGGFDANFIPPVSFRFETEFAKRLVAAGGKIFFEPQASIRHLRASSGGTRSQGSHLTSGSPIHGAGDYYYALRWGRGWSRIWYILKRPFRQIRTKFHLAHPWFIPIKFIGELRAIGLAFQLSRSGPKWIARGEGGGGVCLRRIVLVNTVAPDRPNGSMVRYGAMVREALERFARDTCTVEELNLAPTQAWLDHFPRRIQAPIRYLCIAMHARRLLPKQRNGLLHLLDGSHAYLLEAVQSIRSPLVITVHDMIPALSMRGELAGARPGRGAKWIIQRVVANLPRADALVTVSENTRADVIRMARVVPAHVFAVLSAVSALAGATPAAANGAAAPFILHVAGNNNFYKNRPGVIDIFKIIRQSEPVALKLVGAPPDAALLDKIESSGMGAAIEFLTQVSEAELASLYRNAALLLFPSLYEGFGWPPLEAMSQGCPVVCSNAGSLSEIAGEAALVAPPGEIAALADHCLALLRDPDLRRRRIEAGFQHARRFTLEALANGLVSAYRAAEISFRIRNESRSGD